MGKKAAEIAALREQVKALQAEVAALRAVPWWQGGGVHVGDVPGLTWWFPNVCAGAAPAPQTWIYNTAGANPVTFEFPATTFGAAGCAPQAQTFMVTTGP